VLFTLLVDSNLNEIVGHEGYLAQLGGQMLSEDFRASDQVENVRAGICFRGAALGEGIDQAVGSPIND